MLILPRQVSPAPDDHIRRGVLAHTTVPTLHVPTSGADSERPRPAPAILDQTLPPRDSHRRHRTLSLGQSGGIPSSRPAWETPGNRIRGFFCRGHSARACRNRKPEPLRTAVRHPPVASWTTLPRGAGQAGLGAGGTYHARIPGVAVLPADPATGPRRCSQQGTRPASHPCRAGNSYGGGAKNLARFMVTRPSTQQSS